MKNDDRGFSHQEVADFLTRLTKKLVGFIEDKYEWVEVVDMQMNVAVRSKKTNDGAASIYMVGNDDPELLAPLLIEVSKMFAERNEDYFVAMAEFLADKAEERMALEDAQREGKAVH